MKKIQIVILLLVSLVFLNSCSNKEDTVESDYYVYYINSNETALVKQAFTPKHTDKEDLIREFIQALRETPKDVTSKKPISDGIHRPTYLLSEGGTVVRLNFDISYNTLTGAQETLHRAAIVKTLSQIPGITGVEFYINQVALQEDGKVVGVMNANTFIEGSNYQAQQNIVLCYANKDYDTLVAVDATADYDGSTSLEKIIIDQLIRGPANIKDLNQPIYSVIPRGTRCNSIVTIDYCCYVDLSSEFLKKTENMDDELIVYSIVNSLTSLPAVNKVKFTIDGEKVRSYGSVDNFDQYFEINYDLIKES